jgi:hypothetical protein
MGDVVKLTKRRPRPRRPHSDDTFEREKCLRIVSNKLGYALVKPWCAEERNIPSHGPYMLVRDGTGLKSIRSRKILCAKGACEMKRTPNEPPPLTNSEMDVAFRKGATDEEIAAAVRDLDFWSFIMRDPLGKVCALGKGTRADCIRSAFELSDKHAAEELPGDALEREDEIKCLNGPWRLVLWPPRLDRDPLCWLDCDLEDEDDDETHT